MRSAVAYGNSVIAVWWRTGYIRRIRARSGWSTRFFGGPILGSRVHRTPPMDFSLCSGGASGPFEEMEEERTLATTMHRQLCAAHIGGKRRGEIQAGTGDVRRAGEAAQWELRTDPSNALRAAIMVLGIIGRYVTGNDGIDANLRPPLHRETLCRLKEAGLGRAVGHRVG